MERPVLVLFLLALCALAAFGLLAGWRHRAARLRDGADADPDCALVRIEETSHESQCRRLATTRRAQKTDERTVRDGQTQ